MDQGSDQGLKEIEIAAPTLGLEVQSLQVRSPSNFESAFKAAIADNLALSKFCRVASSIISIAAS